MSDNEKNLISLPLDLRHSLESGECVLFLGAGIGKHLVDPAGKTAPTGGELATELAAQFDVEAAGSSDLAKIAQVIELRKKGRKELHGFLQKRLSDLTPDKDLLWLLARPWKAIFTTNYDAGIERAYELNPNPVQKPVVATVTVDLAPVNPMFEVPVFHLHGALFGVADPHIIITEDDYATFRERRKMLFELLKTEFATSTILYIGYSHNDSNWKILVNEVIAEFAGAGRPISYRIAPTTPPLDFEILKAKGVETLSTDLSAFVSSASVDLIDVGLSPDRLKRVQSAVPTDLASHFEKSPAGVARLLSSWTYVNQAPFHEASNVKRFLHGDRANWGLLARREFFERDIEETVYDDILDFVTSSSKKSAAIAVLGAAGYGMSTLVMTLAADLVGDRAASVFFHKPGTPLLEGDILFAASLFPERRPVFFVDNAADNAGDILNSLYRLREVERPAMFVLAERLNEWRIGHGKLNVTEYVIEPLSDPEIWRLLEFLGKHGVLNTLEHLEPALQFAAIKKKHDKQLLVAMREATEDKAFDAIIEDEYMHLGSDEARSLYLTVCCFYQHGALVRDNLLADLLGMSLENMYKLTGDATEGVVVYDCVDPVRGTYVARARHRTIASIVWDRCGEIVRKESLILSVLSALNLNYKPDADAFEQFIRSDRLVDSIRTLDGKTRFFETAIKKDPESPYVRQHYARMLSRAERPELALSQIEKAIELNSNIRVLYHTQGVVLSQLAISNESLEVARRRLAQSEQAFRRGLTLYNKDEYSYYSLAKLYLDWAKKVPSESAEYVSKCEAVISEGLRIVPSKENLWIMSAGVREWIGNEPGKISDLEHAVKEQPRAVFPRYLLARAYRFAMEPKKAIETLDPILKENPEEFRLCMEYARALDDLGDSYDKAISILGLGNLYGFNDPRFIAIFGGMYFMNGQYSEADRIFAETIKRDFAPYEANTVHYRPLTKSSPVARLTLKGKVVQVRAGYAFIEVPGLPRFLCPSSKQLGVTLRPGMTVTFEPAFSARGAIAEKPKDTYTGPEHKRPV